MKLQNKYDFEKIINLVVVLAIIIVTGIVVKKYVFDSTDPIQKIEIEQKFSIPEVNWEQNGQTLLLAVKIDCPFCEMSAPFFRQLSDEGSKRNIKIEVVSSDSVEDSKIYLEKFNISVQRVHQISLRKYGFIGTPTLLFVNQDGIVKDMWVGKIDSQNSITVLNKLNVFTDPETSNENLSSAKNQITSTQLKNSLESRTDVLIIDVDPREEFSGLHIVSAKNIPADEIVTRASRERVHQQSTVNTTANC